MQTDVEPLAMQFGSDAPVADEGVRVPASDNPCYVSSMKRRMINETLASTFAKTIVNIGTAKKY
ncbi:MAG: hypothetical protein H0V90_13695 [Blastocatellia bacterium]|nr:hypothetical protein [Blastocatellia bacterium]